MVLLVKINVKRRVTNMGLIHCKLRVLMAERGLNIQNVKDRTTLSRTTISNLYNNYGSGIQFDTLKQLCELLNCQPGDLLTYIEIEPNFDVITVYSSNEYDLVSDSDVDKEVYYNAEASLEMICHLLYEGNNYEFIFDVEVSYHMDSDKIIEEIYIGIYESLHTELDRYMIPHAKEHFLNELSDFLLEWGFLSFPDVINDFHGAIVNYRRLQNRGD